MGFLNLSDPPKKIERIVDYDSPSPTLTLGQRLERDLREAPPFGWSRAYLLLLIALIPLLVALLQPPKKYDVQERLAHTLSRLPVQDQARIGTAFELNKQPLEGLLMSLPDHRIENAHLARDSWTHWIYAAGAAGLFFALLLLMFPSSRAQPLDLLRIGLFTGTIGTLLLLLFQFAAASTQGAWPIPRGMLSLMFAAVFYVLKFFGYFYSSAINPSSGLVASWAGFTLGVGYCEETCKLMPLVRHFRYKATLDWRGACMWGMASGVGFGITEGIFYASRYNGIQTVEIYAVRFISCVVLHAMWTGAAAITLYERQNSVQEGDPGFLEHRGRLLQIIAIPMILHGLYDTSLKREMIGLALLVALFSFVWIALKIERMRQLETRTLASAPAV